jgi:hypothetical protein
VCALLLSLSLSQQSPTLFFPNNHTSSRQTSQTGKKPNMTIKFTNFSGGSSEHPNMPMRPKNQSSTPSLVQVLSLPSEDGLLVKIQPPKMPSNGSQHLVASPCDIVLAIDVSGSMGTDAPAPEMAGEEKEEYGLSVLDLVKHAARTILETLDAKDRLGIVTFASQSKVGISSTEKH